MENYKRKISTKILFSNMVSLYTHGRHTERIEFYGDLSLKTETSRKEILLSGGRSVCSLNVKYLDSAIVVPIKYL